MAAWGCAYDSRVDVAIVRTRRAADRDGPMAGMCVARRAACGRLEYSTLGRSADVGSMGCCLLTSAEPVSQRLAGSWHMDGPRLWVDANACPRFQLGNASPGVSCCTVDGSLSRRGFLAPELRGGKHRRRGRRRLNPCCRGAAHRSASQVTTTCGCRAH